jgi:hypothetical protein
LDRTIDITGIDRPLRVRAGQHRIVVTGDDFEAKVESFVVRRGKEELVSIALVPKAAMHPAEVKSPDSTMTKRPAGPTLPLAENPADGVVTPQKPVVPSPAPDNSPNDPESELNYKRFIRDTYKLFPPGSLKPAAGITPQVEAAAKKAIIGAWECDTEVMVPYLMKKRNIGRQDAELAAKLVSFFRADITGNTIFLQSNPKENGKGEYKVVDKAEDSVTIEITKSIEHIAVGEKWTFVIEKGSLGIRLDDMVICMRRKE